jgi:hypothetical protein
VLSIRYLYSTIHLEYVTHQVVTCTVDDFDMKPNSFSCYHPSMTPVALMFDKYVHKNWDFWTHSVPICQKMAATCAEAKYISILCNILKCLLHCIHPLWTAPRGHLQLFVFHIHFSERCRTLVALARKYNLLLFSEDVYNLLYYSGNHPPKRCFFYDNK